MLIIILSLPQVQTKLANAITKRLNKEFKTDINANQISIKYDGMVKIEDVLILDHKQDTLISVAEINTSLLNIETIVNNNLNLGKVTFNDVLFNLKTYKGERFTGLDVFVQRFDEETPSGKPKNKFVLSSEEIDITNGRFRIIDENLESQEVLDFDDIKTTVSNFLVDGSDVSLDIEKLALLDSRGLRVKNLNTKFKYTPLKMTFDDLLLQTKKSEVKGSLYFDYKRGDLPKFTDRVKVTANINKSKIRLDELNVFYNEFGSYQTVYFSTLATGTLNDLKAKKFRLTSNNSTKIYGDVVFKNLFKNAKENFVVDGDFQNLSSDYASLKGLLPNVLGNSIPELFKNMKAFKLQGKTKITTKDVVADFDMYTALGFVKSNLELRAINDIENASYKGNIILDEFDLGALVNDKYLSKVSLNLDLNGSGFNQKNVKTTIKGDIYDLIYKGYLYRDLKAEGQLKQNIYNGKLIANDENLKLEFNGLADLSQQVNTFDFIADIKYANFKKLNLFKTRDNLSEFVGIVDMKVKGTSLDDAVGDILFRNTFYKNENDLYAFKDFFIKSYFKNDERFLKINSPDIIEGDLTGNFKLKTIPKLFKNAILSTYSGAENIIAENDKYQYINFNLKVYNKVIEAFFPKIKLGKNTFVKGHVEGDEKEFRLTFKSPEIQYLDYYADNVELQIDNKNPLFNTYVQIDSLKSEAYKVANFNLINVSVNDTLHMRSEFKGGNKLNDKYELSFYQTKSENNKTILGFKKSFLELKNNKWVINNAQNQFNKIEFEEGLKSFDINKFTITHQDAVINLAGRVNDSLQQKDVKLDFKNINLQKITPDIDGVVLKGIVNGDVNLLQEKTVFKPISNLSVDEFSLNNYTIGDVGVKVKTGDVLNTLLVNAKVKKDKKMPLYVDGKVNLQGDNSSLDLDVNLEKFSLTPLNSFLEGVLSNVRGKVFGKLKVKGNYKSPDYSGKLIVNEGGLKIPYLNVDYAFQDLASVTVKKGDFKLNNVEIKDSFFNSKGQLNGSILHNDFSKWALDLDVKTDRLLVLNTTETEESLYYGTAFIEGLAGISGPADELRINVKAKTEKGTVFKIPLSDTETFGDVSYIKFISAKDKQEKKNNSRQKNDLAVKGLQLDFDLDINENAEIEIVIDKESGSNIIGRGVGGLLAEINTNGKFNIYGDFSVFSGIYNFLYGGLVEKQFTVQPGGTLAWTGDPFNAEMNIKALYKTRTNPSPLLEESINTSIPVNLAINLTGQLEQPDIDFSFEFPNLSSTVKSELAYRLDSREERQNQALYMLSTGSFSQGLSDLSIAGTLTERFNGLINGILSNNDNKLNIGVNYQAGQNRPDYQTDDRLGVTLQTKISDRVLINGKVGVPIGGVGQSVVAGDVQIDFLLNEEGTLTAKVFNRENSIRNFTEEIGYTQGAGIAYNVDFDTFGELIRKIFKGKAIKKARQEKIKKKDVNVIEDSLPSEVDSN